MVAKRKTPAPKSKPAPPMTGKSTATGTRSNDEKRRQLAAGYGASKQTVDRSHAGKPVIAARTRAKPVRKGGMAESHTGGKKPVTKATRRRMG